MRDFLQVLVTFIKIYVTSFKWYVELSVAIPVIATNFDGFCRDSSCRDTFSVKNSGGANGFV